MKFKGDNQARKSMMRQLWMTNIRKDFGLLPVITIRTMAFWRDVKTLCGLL